MDFLEKLDHLMKSRGLNKNTLSGKCGVPYSTIDSLYKKGYENIKLSTLKKIADFFGVSMEFFSNDALGLEYLQKETSFLDSTFTPQGQKIGRAYEKADPPVQRTVEVALEPYMENSEKGGSVAANNAELSEEFCPDIKLHYSDTEAQDDLKDDEDSEMTDIPCYDLPAAAGFGNYLSDDASYEMMPFPADDIPAHVDFGIRISGSSMEPTIGDGSIVWVEAMPAVENGDIGIFILNGDAYCKELCVESRNGRRKVMLISHNEDYGDIEIKEGDELRTVGKVIAVAEEGDR